MLYGKHGLKNERLGCCFYKCSPSLCNYCLVCLHTAVDMVFIEFFLAVSVEYRCIKWAWVGDVYNRKVYCIEWKKVDKK